MAFVSEALSPSQNADTVSTKSEEISRWEWGAGFAEKEFSFLSLRQGEI